MVIKQKNISVNGIKLYIEQAGEEIARAFLYILKNDLREQPFGFMEDVFVQENYRGRGLASQLLKELILIAKENNCYKIIGNSRYDREKVHRLYERAGFKKFGFEFKMYFDKENK